MPFVNYGLVGHKIKVAASAGDLGACIDQTAQFPPKTTVLFSDGLDVYQAVYVYCGQTVSGSAFVMVATSGTASVTASGYVAMMSAGLAADPGDYIWVRSSAITGVVAN